MLIKPLPPLYILRQLLSYSPETGRLEWLPRTKDMGGPLVNRWNGRYAGTEALGKLDRKGYKVGKIFTVTYQSHRIIWLLHTGEQPDFIDHINGNKSDNRITNLRSVPWSENALNRPMPRNNKSGAIGVHWCNSNKWWVAQISIGGKQRQLGVFGNKEDAIARRAVAEKEMGFHENHGR